MWLSLNPFIVSLDLKLVRSHSKAIHMGVLCGIRIFPQAAVPAVILIVADSVIVSIDASDDGVRVVVAATRRDTSGDGLDASEDGGGRARQHLATGSVTEGMLPVGTLTGSEGALAGREGDGLLTGSEGEGAPTGSEDVSTGSSSASALGVIVGTLTGSDGAPAEGELTGGEGAPTIRGSTGSEGAAAEGKATEGVLVDGTPTGGVPTAGWLSKRSATEGPATDGALSAGAFTGSDGIPLVGSALAGTLTGTLIDGMADGAPTGSPEGMAGRLIPGASTDRPRVIDGVPIGRSEGTATGRPPLAGTATDGLFDGAPTGGLTGGVLTPLTGSEGAAGRLVSPANKARQQ
ncbi:hypothetical protein C8T65DRAFT_212235 [Cerioporus squamosus]|nr:hypothetical protein C8T65DRAFT_212235 [Cerioporus squamosus]